MKLKMFCLAAVLILNACSKGGSDDADPVILSSENRIISFILTINAVNVSGEIDQQSREIVFNVVGADVSSLVPQIEYSAGATITPSSSTAMDFREQVSYTVYAENGDVAIYKVIVNNRPLSTENNILQFNVELDGNTVEANIDEETGIIVFNSADFDISQLTPNIEISEMASISPSIGATLNFESKVTYIVTAENGDTKEYYVYANPPIIDFVGSKVGAYSNNPILFYSGADIRVAGNFLNHELSDSELYISDGSNSYPLSVDSFDTYDDESTLSKKYNVYAQIPEEALTGSNYRIYFRKGDYITQSESLIDLLKDGGPAELSLNQEIYVRGDTMVITGVNLYDEIAIPSNGNHYIITPRYYDISVNSERTEIIFELTQGDARHLFPSYYRRDAHEKVITVLGPDRRTGKTISAIFN